MVTKDLRQQVFLVCEKFHEQGNKPSVRRVRDELPEQHSISTIHPHLKAWLEAQEAERDRIRQSYQCSENFMDALASETGTLIKNAIKQEKEQIEAFRSLIEEANNELQLLESKLAESKNIENQLKIEKQAINNEYEVLKQSQVAKHNAIKAEAKRQISEHSKRLDISNALKAEQKNEIASLRASLVELRVRCEQAEKQAEVQVKQQQLLVAKNHDLQTQQTYLNVELAARDAQIEELKKANANIELLRLDLQRYGKRKDK